MQDAESDFAELILGDLEQLVARIRLDDVDQRLVVVTPLRKTRALEHALRLPPKNGNLPRACAVRRVCVQAEKAPFSDDLTRGIEALHADVVEVRGPVHRGAGVRLREVEQALLARKAPHLGWEPKEADGRRPLVSAVENPE